MKRTELVHVRIKPALKDLIEEKAKEQDTTRSDVVRKILASYFTHAGRG